MDSNPKVTAAEPPRGFHQARVDERGRLKLPAVFQQYLGELGEKRLFITTLDERTVRLYPIPVWKENENLFESAGADAQEADDIATLAQHYGADSDVDGQGRVLLPQELREKLNLESQAVHLRYDKGVIAGYGETVYKERLNTARERNPDSLNAMNKRGLK